MTSLILLGVIAVLALFVIGIYNRLVRLKNQVKNSWSQIDVQLQRRYDLIPNLIEAVKGYMTYEKGTLEAVVKARSQAMNARAAVASEGDAASMQKLSQAEGELGGVLSRLFALSENYPALKANENMLNLQEELSSTENKIAFSRQAYNDQVLAYNNAQQQFPAVLLAGAFGHKETGLFELNDAEAKKAVKVSF